MWVSSDLVPLTQNGRTDEWVDIEDYLLSVKVAAAIIVGWCGAVDAWTSRIAE